MVEPERVETADEEATSERSGAERSEHQSRPESGAVAVAGPEAPSSASKDVNQAESSAQSLDAPGTKPVADRELLALAKARRRLAAVWAVLDESPDSLPEAEQLLRSAWTDFGELGSVDATGLAESDASTCSELRRSAQRLQSAIDAKRAALGLVPAIDVYPKYLAWAALAVLVVFGGWYASQQFGPDVWLARYFDNVRFQGEPVKKTYGQLELDWGRDRVDPKLPHNSITARFETCLRVSEEGTVHFFMEAKDGAILKVDGRKVASTWRAKKLARDTGNVKLAPGLHHVEISYYNATGSGRLSLLASFGSQGYRPINSKIAQALTPRAHERKPAKRCEPDPPESKPSKDESSKQQQKKK